ncbi:hypothetical protein PSEMO_23830 [Pseudomonas putida]|uniref:Uncharacterized protein n=1 Tax=Pseudomonas putida TaxID=303 RepID=A0A1Q9R5G2_PSEPU|nr:hypothetical protein PSEMO_23830 [Pseudomonas putida]
MGTLELTREIDDREEQLFERASFLRETVKDLNTYFYR